MGRCMDERRLLACAAHGNGLSAAIANFLHSLQLDTKTGIAVHSEATSITLLVHRHQAILGHSCCQDELPSVTHLL